MGFNLGIKDASLYMRLGSTGLSQHRHLEFRPMSAELFQTFRVSWYIGQQLGAKASALGLEDCERSGCTLICT